MDNKITFDQVIEVGCAADVHKSNIVATIRWGSEKLNLAVTQVL